MVVDRHPSEDGCLRLIWVWFATITKTYVTKTYVGTVLLQ